MAPAQADLCEIQREHCNTRFANIEKKLDWILISTITGLFIVVYDFVLKGAKAFGVE